MPRRSSVAVARPAADFTVAIAERAYFKAERRGFAPGHELDDWLAAEREQIGVFQPAAPAVAKPPAAAKPKQPAAPRKSAAASKTKPSKTK